MKELIMCSARWSPLAAVLIVTSAGYLPLALAQDAVDEFEQIMLAAGGFKHAVMEIALNAFKKLPSGQKTLVVGEFTGSAQGATPNSGPAIQYALIRELAKLGVKAEKEAPFELKGDYSLIKDGGFFPYAFKLNSRLLAQQRDEVIELPVAKWSNVTVGELAPLLGITAGPRWGDNEGKKYILDLQWDPRTPSVYLDGTRIRSSRNSPYAVEILVKAEPEGRAVAVEPRIEGGLAYAPIKRNEFYEVRVINESKYDAAVKLAIDGLDQFTFSDLRDPETGEPAYRYLVFYKETSYAIRGWHRTNEVADAFVVTSYAKSAAGRQLLSSAKAGTITVRFAAAWFDFAKKPPDEYDGPTAQSGTGRGPAVATKLGPMVRPNLGRTRDALTVRYTR
jgi:hypothetical protein